MRTYVLSIQERVSKMLKTPYMFEGEAGEWAEVEATASQTRLWRKPYDTSVSWADLLGYWLDESCRISIFVNS